jgi:hypothetical protein
LRAHVRDRLQAASVALARSAGGAGGARVRTGTLTWLRAVVTAGVSDLDRVPTRAGYER